MNDYNLPAVPINRAIDMLVRVFVDQFKDTELSFENVEREAGEMARAVALTLIADKATLINNLVAMCHADNAKWWLDPKTGASLKDNPLTFPTKIMLIVSELAEALEADRSDAMDDKLTHRPGREVELADAIIRILDLAGAYGLDLGCAFVEKNAYNAKRADHKPEARRAAGGKRY